ncbi:acyltransferase family protein [Pseudomonas protegens]|uniref:acyltransferase family protein n=1 Tax=Pseudomonas protegens TaxID=380021 RepID=UPI00276436B9|nr:acyltransferase [Pseudomonas protegens]MDP9528466.1 acyltransferase [Pseudomonas protegens]
MNTKLSNVEAIRGLACIAVIFSHLSLTFFPYLHTRENELTALDRFIYDLPLGFLYSGASSVFIFFALSGFILTHIIIKSEHRVKRTIYLAVKRYPRLMLPVLASCITSYCVFKLNPDVSMLSPWINKLKNNDPNLLSAIYDGTITAFFIGGTGKYNAVLWTMKIELIGSFLIFAICFVSASRTAHAASSLLGLAIIIYTTNGMEQAAYVLFLLGGITSTFGIKVGKKNSFIMLAAGFYLSGYHTGSAAYALIDTIKIENMWIYANAIGAMLVVYPMIHCVEMQKYLEWPSLQRLGELSFPAYLIHLPSIFLVSPLVFTACMNATNSAYLVSATISCILTLTFILKVSAKAFHVAIDKPSLAILKKIENRS